MLRIWLPLNGDLTQQGTSNASITNTSATINTTGKIGSCYQFGTGKSYLKFDDVNFIHDFTECSVSLWLKIISWNTSYATYFQFGKGSTPWAHYIFGLLRNNAASTLCFTISNGSSATKASYLTPALDLNTWYHLTFTYTPGHCRIYVNGVQTSEYDATIVPNFAQITTGTIGIANNVSNYQTNCLINDFRVYDHCLSAAEVKEISQGLVLHYKLDSIQDGILDSSGYGHKTSTIGTLMLDEDDSARYTNSIKFNGSNTAIKITENNWAVQGMREMTINVWAKSSSWSGAHLFSCTESGGFNTENGSSGYLRFPVNVYTNAAQTSTAYKYDSQEIQISALSTDKWNMLTFVYDSTGTRTYINGILHHTYTNVSYGIHFNLNARLFLGCEANTASPYTPYYNGQMSDFRLYTTALSAEDIKQLYQVGAKVDNLGNIHTYELNEAGTNKLLKTGVLKDNIVEPFITLPDGSYWQLMLFHYVDGGHNLFTSSNATNCNDFGLYSRLKDINNFTYNGKYEFYVIQDDIEYRWTQTNQPTASSIAGLTTVSGYNNPVNGLAKASQSYTYIGYGSWWGACGCWTSYSTGGKTGIPGFGSHNANGICTRYLALYARIEKPRAKLSNLTASAVHFIEF